MEKLDAVKYIGLIYGIFIIFIWYYLWDKTK